MTKDIIEASGVIVQSLPNAMFRVKLEGEGYNNHEILCMISGKIRLHYIKLVPGDRVKVELTPYDLTKGRIVYRMKEEKKSREEDPIEE